MHTISNLVFGAKVKLKLINWFFLTSTGWWNRGKKRELNRGK